MKLTIPASGWEHVPAQSGWQYNVQVTKRGGVPQTACAQKTSIFLHPISGYTSPRACHWSIIPRVADLSYLSWSPYHFHFYEHFLLLRVSFSLRSPCNERQNRRYSTFWYRHLVVPKTYKRALIYVIPLSL